MKRFILPRVTDREFAHILAGLRILQCSPATGLEAVSFIIEREGHQTMSAREIDSLCERLNCGD